MKFLADENIEREIVASIRDMGFQVTYISEEVTSLTDNEVLKIANRKKLIILTNDKDFGELTFQQKLTSNGIILLRLDSEKVEIKINKLKLLLERFKDKLSGHFVVITENKVRFREITNK